MLNQLRPPEHYRHTGFDQSPLNFPIVHRRMLPAFRRVLRVQSRGARSGEAHGQRVQRVPGAHDMVQEHQRFDLARERA